MEVRRALSEWWFIALVSLTAGGLAFLLLYDIQGTLQSIFIWTASLTLAGWVTFITGILMTVGPWRPLKAEGIWDPVKLCQVGYEVTIRGDDFDLRVAKYSIVRIRVRDGRYSYRTLPTSTGLWALFLIGFSPFFLTIAAFPFLLHVYVQAQKGLGTLVPEVRGSKRPMERSIDELVMDSLTSAYLMARQSADAGVSRLHDHCIILVTLAILGFGALLISSVRLPFDPDENAWRLGGGTVVLVTITIIGMMALWWRARRTIEEDEQWAIRLMAVMKGSVPEGGSSVELLLQAISEAPRWLNAHRRAMWYRRPGMTLFIALLLDQGTILLFIGAGLDMMRLIGGSLFALGVLLLLDQYRRGRKESDRLKEEWGRKLLEMENVLGLTGER